MELSEPFLLKIGRLRRKARAAGSHGRAGYSIAQPETRVKGHIEDKNAGAAMRRGGI